jgi:hypothetical protein
MGERVVPTPEEEIESLLQRQPRRMPSPALWDRLSAGVQRSAPQSTGRLRWVMTAGVMAAVAVVAVWAWHMIDRPAPSRPAFRPHETGAPNSVAVKPGAAVPTQIAQAVPAAEPRARPRTARSPAHTGDARSAEPQSVRSDPVIAQAAAEPKTIVAAPGRDERTEQQAAEPAASGDVGAESSYYLEVTRGNERSVLSGSVVRDEARGVTEITIAYSPAARGQDEN